MTSIHRIIRRQRCKRCKNGGGKGRHTCVRYVVGFPEGFDVAHLVGRKLEFQRIGDELSIKPKYIF